MLSDFAFYQIAAITILVIWNLYFIYSLLYPRLKKWRLAALVIILLTPFVIKLVFSNKVYIFNDDNQIQAMNLVIPSRFLLNNGQYALLKPKPGLTHYWLINNGTKQAWLECVSYGNHENLALTRQAVEPYSSAQVKEIEYFFEAPPKHIRAINPQATKGWLHR